MATAQTDTECTNQRIAVKCKAKDNCPWRFYWDLPRQRKPFSRTAIFLSRLLS